MKHTTKSSLGSSLIFKSMKESLNKIFENHCVSYLKQLIFLESKKSKA